MHGLRVTISYLKPTFEILSEFSRFIQPFLFFSTNYRLHCLQDMDILERQNNIIVNIGTEN